MSEINIDVALGYLQDTLHKLCDKHFVAKQELSRYEQELLVELHTTAIKYLHMDIIRKHFSVK